jgi:hypothetical protein
MTYKPQHIHTHVPEEVAAKVQAKVGVGYQTVSLGAGLIARVLEAFAALKAREVALVVTGPEGTIRVGDERGHVAEFPLRTLVPDEDYVLTFGEHLIDVLATVRDGAVMRLGGPDNLIAVDDSAGYRYLVSPKETPPARPAPAVATEAQPATPAAEPAAKAAAENADEVPVQATDGQPATPTAKPAPAPPPSVAPRPALMLAFDTPVAYVQAVGRLGRVMEVEGVTGHAAAFLRALDAWDREQAGRGTTATGEVEGWEAAEN